MFLATIFEGEAVGECLGNGLNGELAASIPDFVKVTIPRGDADTKQIWIHLGEARDVVRHTSFIEGGVAFVEGFEDLRYGGFHRDGRDSLAAPIPKLVGFAEDKVTRAAQGEVSTWTR